jgi:hypothetical protein
MPTNRKQIHCPRPTPRVVACLCCSPFDHSMLVEESLHLCPFVGSIVSSIPIRSPLEPLFYPFFLSSTSQFKISFSISRNSILVGCEAAHKNLLLQSENTLILLLPSFLTYFSFFEYIHRFPRYSTNRKRILCPWAISLTPFFLFAI